jgi:hypothetical protein
VYYDPMPVDADAPRSPASRGLSHPAALLVLTAVLTGLLVPWITSRWEARDKEVEARRTAVERELEVQSAIVSRVGTASADFLSAMEVGVVAARGPEAQAAYRRLQTASLEIASQLAAYFPRSRPEVRWRDYTYSLRNAYLLLNARVGRARNRWLDPLNRYLDYPATQFDGLCFPRDRPVFAQDLRELVVALQNKEGDVVREIADSATVLTGTPTPDRNVPRRHYDPTQRTPCNRYF